MVTDSDVMSNPKIDAFACYRNVPCHQACFYDERLMFGNHFDLKYKVRADYEQFLRCFYREKAVTDYMGITIANYEGGGYSAQNKKISEEERKEIIKHYLTGSQIRKYDFLRVVTFAKFRTFLDSNKDHYMRIRVASDGKQGADNEFALDFLELVPKSVYGTDGEGNMEDDL